MTHSIFRGIGNIPMAPFTGEPGGRSLAGRFHHRTGSMSETMRAVVITEFGGPEVLAVRDVPLPEPGHEEVRVRTSTSGVNRADLLQRLGRYPAPAGWPESIPGLEFAGVVDAVGRDVDSVAVGDAVMGILGGGGYAEYVVTRADTVVPVPATLTVEEAGAVPEVFMTAFDALFLQEGLKSGECLLIHAVGSGVGTAALQMAASIGARVIGTSRTQGKLDQAVAMGLQHGVPGTRAGPRRSSSSRTAKERTSSSTWWAGPTWRAIRRCSPLSAGTSWWACPGDRRPVST